MTDIAQCAELVRQGDPIRFASAMTAPPGAERDALMVLYAFNLEVARAPHVTAEPLIAQMRLQWWRDAVAEIFDPAAGVRRHEVTTPLADLVAARSLPRAPFDAMIDAREWDIAGEGFADVAALQAHLEQTGGALMELGVLATGGRAGAGRLYGGGAALANWLLAVPALMASGRDPLPAMSAEGRAGLLDWGLTRLSDGRRAARGGRAALRAGYLAGGILRRARRDPEAIEQGRLAPSEFSRRAGLLWRAVSGRI